MKDFLCDKSLESFIRNLYHGYSYGDIISLMVIAIMWNLTITVLTPTLEEIKILHNSDKPNVVVVHNGEDNLEGHYCATVGIEDSWVPVKGKDQTYTIKTPTSVKLSVEQAEEHYLSVKHDQIKSDYDFITSELDAAMNKVFDLRTSIDEMEKKLVTWTNTASSLINKLDHIKAKMIMLGVKCNDSSKRLNIVMLC